MRHPGKRRLQQVEVQIGPFTGPVSGSQGIHDADHQIAAGAHVDHRRPDPHRGSVRLSGGRHDPRHRLGPGVIAAQFARRAALTEAGDRGIEAARALDQSLHDASTVGLFEIDANAALVPVDHGEGGAAIAWAEMVAAGRLYLDHVGAKLGQQHGPERPGQRVGKVQDGQALKRARHERAPFTNRTRAEAFARTRGHDYTSFVE